MRMRLRFASWCMLGVAVTCGSSAEAVKTGRWLQASEKDFQEGTFDGTVVTSMGNLRLAREVTPLVKLEPAVDFVHAIVRGKDGVVYAGTGWGGKVYRIDQGAAKVFCETGDDHVFSLIVDGQGGLVAGTGGERGRVLAIDAKGQATELFADPDVKYVWALTAGQDGRIFAATGPKGLLIAVSADRKSASRVYDFTEDNLTAMIGGPDGMLYVGTDSGGLVYRVNPVTKAAFAMYDADQEEVSALLLDAEGNLFLGTSGTGARAGATAASPVRAGRPEPKVELGPGAKPKPKAEPEPKAKPGDNAEGKLEAEPAHNAKAGHSSSEPEPRAEPEDKAKPEDNARPEGKAEPGGKAAAGDEAGPGLAAQPNDESPTSEQKPSTRPASTRKLATVPAKTPAAEAPSPPAARVPPAAAKGNGIYKIDREGFVSEVYSGDVMILCMVKRHRRLTFGTGIEGRIFEVDVDGEESAPVAKLDGSHVTSMIVADGQTLAAAANPGGVYRVSSGHASKGIYTSDVLDASQISSWGRIQANVTTGKVGAITVATRSSNVADPESPAWSEWSAEQPLERYTPVRSAPARYLQYRLTLTTKASAATPVVRELALTYLVQNLPPQITAVEIIPAKRPAAGGASRTGAGNVAERDQPDDVWKIKWTATDANKDDLEYELYLRPVGETEWIKLDEELTSTEWEWDTKTVGDGEYEIKVVASDAPDNPVGSEEHYARISEPHVVDNTAPVIERLEAKPLDKGVVEVVLEARDATTNLTAIKYTVDSANNWRAVLPVDRILDSPSERCQFQIRDLDPGRHQIAVKAVDERNNAGYATVVVTTR